MHKGYWVIALACVMLFSGCGLWNCEVERPSDITIAELLDLQQQATDPSNLYAAAGTLVQRQVVIRPGLLYGENRSLLVTTYKKPSFFKLTTTLEGDSKPSSDIIYNGTEAALIDHRRNQVIPFTGTDLELFKTTFAFGMPGSDPRTVFKEVDIALVTIDDIDYYKLTCRSDSKDIPVFNIYIDSNDYLTRMIRTTGASLEYESSIDTYGTYEDMFIPTSGTSRRAGETERWQLVFFQLDVTVGDQEFVIPKR